MQENLKRKRRPGNVRCRRRMTLYHFCAAHDIRSILGNGLTDGRTPVWENGELRMETQTQWLTADKDPSRQSWNTRQMLPYSRTAYRLTVSIPYSYRKKLIPAKEFMERYPAENAGLVEGWAGSENWYVFLGKIPPAWIVASALVENRDYDKQP